jgi:hypothetical protein
MSQEQVAGQAKPQPSQSTEKATPAKKPGEYLIKHEDIPPAVSKLMRDKMGEGSEVHPAKENGTYKGKVIFTNEHYVGQAVGREGKMAIVHRKADIELQGNELKWRMENNRLNNAGVQVFYNGDKGKAYPFNLEKQQAAGDHEHAAAGAGKGTRSPALTAEQVMEQATKYAAENIKNVKQREAFLKHLSAATEQAKAPQEAAKTKTAKAEPAKAKAAADHGIER